MPPQLGPDPDVWAVLDSMLVAVCQDRLLQRSQDGAAEVQSPAALLADAAGPQQDPPVPCCGEAYDPSRHVTGAAPSPEGPIL